MSMGLIAWWEGERTTIKLTSPSLDGGEFKRSNSYLELSEGFLFGEKPMGKYLAATWGKRWKD